MNTSLRSFVIKSCMDIRTNYRGIGIPEANFCKVADRGNFE
jgi:hypothetical protein